MPEPVPPPQPAPVVSLGSSVAAKVAAPIIRTGGQGISSKLILDGLDAFNLYHPTDDQREWLLVFGAIALAGVQNLLEQWRGRKLLGASPEPGTLAGP